MQTLAVLHPADLFRDPSMRVPTHRDWAKVPLILKGAWPLPVPDRLIITPENVSDIHGEQFETIIENAHSANYICIDTEYAQETRFLTLIGVGFRYKETLAGFQVSTARLPRWARGALESTIKSLVNAVPTLCQNSIGAELPVLKKNFGIEHKNY